MVLHNDSSGIRFDFLVLLCHSAVIRGEHVRFYKTCASQSTTVLLYILPCGITVTETCTLPKLQREKRQIDIVHKEKKPRQSELQLTQGPARPYSNLHARWRRWRDTQDS
jgi:hypothetical protein